MKARKLWRWLPILGLMLGTLLMLSTEVDTAMTVTWALVTGFLVIFLQVGFALVEKDSFRIKNGIRPTLKKFLMRTRLFQRANKKTRLWQRLRDPEWRRYAYLLLLGKVGAIALLLMAIPLISTLVSTFTGSAALAVDPVLKGNDIVNPINTVWTLIAAFLVFAMQVGFTMLEAGFCRSRETVNVLMECIVDTCLCGILFYAIGFAFMFSEGNGFIGHHWFFLGGAPATYESTGVAFLAVWIFQFAFADTCSTITSGAMIGRTGFVGDIFYSIAVSGFIYPIIGHWAWGPDGFLATMGTKDHFLPSLGIGFHDFAGSTVVHTIGGFIALAGAIALGPRLGRTFKRDGGGPMLPHDLVIAASGGLILWFGWYGFNPGSTLSALDFQGIGRVAANTTLAACAGGLAAMFVAFPMTKKWDLGFTVNGFLAGLVAITCPCYWVNPTGAIILGAVAGVIVVLGVELLEWLRIDDPIGAVPVHGFCGIWGTWSLGLFATGEFGATGPFGADTSAPLRGLFYGGGTQVLVAQIIGNLIITLSTFAVAMGVMFLVNLTGTLRVSKEGELEGLDLHEHGIPAYPEYVITSSATPMGSQASAQLGRTDRYDVET
ncbi:MAG: ammonium transporter [Chroococcidiopsidaceae cyanobacterium CP_BM_ER_R8_30]|nr:ammonium transporter [Chroococcidiopsidaceae cyanobacterium CP_BM_ER_R8_30]